MEKVRKELVGRVVSSTNNKTITVLVETYKKDPLYACLPFASLVCHSVLQRTRLLMLLIDK